MKTPVTHERLQNHLTYSWWKYVLMMVLVIFFWSILFTTTRYRPPEEKKVIVGVYGAGNQTALDAYMEDVRQLLLPDMEEMNTQFIMSDETWGSSVLMTRMTARECDIYLLPKDLFQTYAQQGVFVALEETMPELVSELESRGISLSRGWRTDSDTGEKHLYGIPCADLPYLDTFLYPTADSYYACIFRANGNEENVQAFFDYFIRDMLNEPPRRLRRKPLRNLIFCGGLQFVARFASADATRGLSDRPLTPSSAHSPTLGALAQEPTSSAHINRKFFARRNPHAALHLCQVDARRGRQGRAGERGGGDFAQAVANGVATALTIRRNVINRPNRYDLLIELTMTPDMQPPTTQANHITAGKRRSARASSRRRFSITSDFC